MAQERIYRGYWQTVQESHRFTLYYDYLRIFHQALSYGLWIIPKELPNHWALTAVPVYDNSRKRLRPTSKKNAARQGFVRFLNKSLNRTFG